MALSTFGTLINDGTVTQLFWGTKQEELGRVKLHYNDKKLKSSPIIILYQISSK